MRLTGRSADAPVRPISPQRVLATLYHVLGIDPAATTLTDHSGWPQCLLGYPDKIVELG